MTKRLAVVVWWVGTFIGVSAALIALVNFATDKPGQPHEVAAFSMIAGAVLLTPCWALSFILGGSFWSPPKLSDDR